mmetsp:Transcript_862/g.1130  ORF Transcript_862/g.1130 Transcript_862/m.1130 type:complete len:91 (+) Transcript_862:287-559(+)
MTPKIFHIFTSTAQKNNMDYKRPLTECKTSRLNLWLLNTLWKVNWVLADTYKIGNNYIWQTSKGATLYWSSSLHCHRKHHSVDNVINKMS